MNKKRIFLIAAILFVIIGGILIVGQDKKENVDDVAKHNQQVLENAGKEEKLAEGVISSDDATYEEWLSAAAVTAVSLTYPEFQIESICTESKTKLSNSNNSKGVYITIVVDGKKYVINSKPLSKERSAEGTIDVYEEKLGYATFDRVSNSSVPKKVTEITMESLDNLISRCELVSLYEHY